MIERTVHGPMEFLAPDTDFNGVLEITGIKLPDGISPTVHVFLEEVGEGELETLKKTANYAGSFTLPADVAYMQNGRATVLLDITHALFKAEQEKPNFHVTLLAQSESPSASGKLFSYDGIHIRHRVPENTDLDISAKVTCGLAVDHEEPI